MTEYRKRWRSAIDSGVITGVVMVGALVLVVVLLVALLVLPGGGRAAVAPGLRCPDEPTTLDAHMKAVDAHISRSSNTSVRTNLTFGIALMQACALVRIAEDIRRFELRGEP